MREVDQFASTEAVKKSVRAQQVSRFAFLSELPVPDAPTVGGLLRARKPHARRPAHRHDMIRGKGLEDTEHADAGVRRSLAARVEPYRAGKAGGPLPEQEPDAMPSFDFVPAPAG